MRRWGGSIFAFALLLAAVVRAAPARAVVPNDPLFDPGTDPAAVQGQWNLASDGRGISAVTAWPITTGQGVTIALIDTGMNFNHEDLQHQYWTNPGETGGGKETNGIDDDGNGYVDDWRGWDFYQDDNDPTDLNGHGTGRAGILAAEQNNGLGITGVAPGAKLMVLRTSNSILHRSDRVAAAIRYAADNGARVINMSLGAMADTPVLRDAMAYAEQHGVVPVVAMANEFSEHTNFPTVFDEAVGAAAIVPDTDGSGSPTASNFTVKASYSNYGPLTDVAAPSSILSTNLNGGYGKTGGTSSATPGVAGVAALVISAAQALSMDLSEQEVVQILRMSADDVVGGPYNCKTGWDRYTGWGRVDAAKAVQMVTTGHIPPVADINSPDWYAMRTGTVAVDAAMSSRAASYSWALSIGRGDQPASFKEVASGDETSPVDGKLGAVDTDHLKNGLYTLRLVVTDADGNTGEDRQAFSLRRDPSIAPGFRKQLDGAIAGGPILANLDGKPGSEVVVADASGRVHAFRAGGKELAGWPVSTPEITWHGMTYHQGFLSGPSVGDIDGDGKPDVVIGSLDGNVYAWDAHGTELPGWPQPTKVPAGPDPANQDWDSAVYGEPTVANIDGQPGVEVIAGAADGKVYAWHGDGTPVPGWPVLLDDPSVPGVQVNPVVSSAAVADLDHDGKVEVVIGSEEHYAHDTRLWALEPDGTSKPGWPVHIGALSPNGLPLVATGMPQSPVLADVNGDGKLEVGATAFTGSFQYVTPGGAIHYYAASPLGPGSNVDDVGAIGVATSPAFGDLNRDGKPDLVTGGAGDHLLDANTHGDGTITPFDHVAIAFDGKTKKFFPAWPRATADWLFLTAPILADVDGDGRPEVIIGNGLGSLDAFRLDGTEPAGWPKRTDQWILGPAAAGDMTGSGEIDVAVGTRLGTLVVYRTAGRRAGLDWPDGHGNPAGTGLFRR